MNKSTGEELKALRNELITVPCHAINDTVWDFVYRETYKAKLKIRPDLEEVEYGIEDIGVYSAIYSKLVQYNL